MNSTSRAQSGAALVIGMVLLLILTVLAISSMNMASTELKMAGNAQWQQDAFQSAEAGIERARLLGLFNPGGGVQTINGSNVPGADTYAAAITPQLLGAAQPALWGSSWDSFSTFHFEINSSANVVSGTTPIAGANNVQGIAIIAPHDPTVTPIDPASTALN